MAILNQLENEYTIFTGWYGDCGDECENFNLTNHTDVIFAVYQFKENAKGVTSFLASAPSFLNSFDELVCGKMYWLVLSPGSGSVELPNFTQTFYSANDENYGYVKGCLSISEVAPQFEVSVSDIEYEGEVNFNSDTSKATVSVKLLNSNDARFTIPYAIGISNVETERGNSANWGAPGNNFKRHYFPTASSEKFTKYEYSNLVEWDSSSQTQTFEVRGLYTEQTNYICVYFANIDDEIGSKVGGSTLNLSKPHTEFQNIDEYHWCTETISIEVPKVLPEPTPTPEPYSSPCCESNSEYMMTYNTGTLQSFTMEFNGVTSEVFSWRAFPEGSLCFDATDLKAPGFSPQFNIFATTKTAYINNEPIGAIKFSLTNLDNIKLILTRHSDMQCFVGTYSNSENSVVFVADPEPESSDDTPTPLPGIVETPTPTPLVSETPTPAAEFAPDYSDREPYPTVDGCLNYINDIGIANGIYYLDGDESRTEQYYLGIGKYLIKNVPVEHPILLDGHDHTMIDLIGTQKASGPFGNGYYGDITIYVKGNFGIVSYKCANHGYMGGHNNLVFIDDCKQTKNNFESLAEEYKFLEPTQKVEQPEIVGYVKYVDLEGGFYGVVSKDEPMEILTEDAPQIRFLPLNLQTQLKGKEGSVIKIIDSYSKADEVSIFMWGELIYVNDFEFIEDGVIGCHKDLKPCGNEGDFVVRDPKLDCNFPPCFFNMDEFLKIRDGWLYQKIADYSFTFNWSCYCHEETTKSVKIEVRNYEVSRITDLDGNSVEPTDSLGYYSMTGLFKFVETELKKYPYSMQCDYDFDTLTLKTWFVDKYSEMADEELGFNVSNFTIENVSTTEE